MNRLVCMLWLISVATWIIFSLQVGNYFIASSQALLEIVLILEAMKSK